MKTKTKGQVEAEISEAIVKLEMQQAGKEPQRVKSYIIEDIIVIRLKGFLTVMEHELVLF